MSRRANDGDGILSTKKFDDVVIGTGQGGKPLAQALARSGRSVAVIERGEIGGSCVVSGCTPTKTWIASARVAHLVRHAERWGVHGGAAGQGGDVKLDFERLQERKNELTRASQEAIRRGFEDAGVELVRGHARFVGPRRLVIEPSGERDGESAGEEQGEDGLTIDAERIFIDVGSKTRVPDLDGLDAVPWIDHAGLLELRHCPEHVIVLGGGVIAVEMAQMLRRFGARVTIVEASERILGSEDEDVADAVRAILEDEGVEILTNASATRVDGDGDGIRLEVQVEGQVEKGRAESQARTLRGSHLLVAVGRVPATENLGLEAAGIDTDEDGHVVVDARLRTSAAGVYALGDVTGGAPFTHYSVDDYRVLRRQLLDGDETASTDGRIVAYCLFTDPELGRVGLSEEQAAEQGRKVRVAKVPMEKIDRAREMDETRGFAKAIVDAESDRILGAAILGVAGGELMSIVHAAMLGDVPFSVLGTAPFAHPTLAEGLVTLFHSIED